MDSGLSVYLTVPSIMDPAPLTAAEKRAIRDFWEVYERHFDEIFSQAESLLLAQVPAMSALLAGEADLADLRRARKQALRQGIIEENWAPSLRVAHQ